MLQQAGYRVRLAADDRLGKYEVRLQACTNGTAAEKE